MSKLYIFGIGGTGSRVLKSLTMLLASGVEINADKIVPVIIDPDHAAADLTRTVAMMRDYNAIRSNLSFDTTQKNNFFKADIDLSIVPDVTMPLENTEDVKFSEYIGYNGMDNKANKAFASMLFSKRNLNADMNVGFKGNPNIGSVVLNQFQNSKVFQDVVGSFAQGDRIFVISSIFGGTGASGFPLLVKNLRAISDEHAGQGNVKDAPIGAITVLPYFTVKPVEDKKSEIDSSTFISKAKAALMYYNQNVSEPDVLYYVGDDIAIAEPYNNVEGGVGQQNDAHIVELISALSIIDFMNIPDAQFQVNNGVRPANIYKEFGIVEKNDPVIFGNLSTQTNAIVQTRMTQYLLFCKFMREHMKDSVKSQTWAKDLAYDDNFLASPFYAKLQLMEKAFYTWLEELARNHRGFSPYKLEENPGELFSLVKGIDPAKVWSLDSNYALFDNRLNSIASSFKTDKGDAKDNNFVELFFQATKKLADEKLRMK